MRGTCGGALAICALLLAPCLRAQPLPAGPNDSVADWVGKIVPPYPQGMVEQQETCIGGGTDDDAPVCHHMIDVVLDPQSHVRTVLVIEAVPHFGNQALGRIVDAIEPAELDDDTLQVAVGLCQENGSDDGRLIAIIDPDVDQEWITTPRRTWRADPLSGRLQPLDTAGIRCRNEGFGYDG